MNNFYRYLVVTESGEETHCVYKTQVQNIIGNNMGDTRVYDTNGNDITELFED